MPPKMSRANKKPSVRALLRRLRLDMKGREYRPPVTPPVIVSNPWNSVVVTMKATKDEIVTAGMVVVNLRKQIGIFPTPGDTNSLVYVDFRVIRVSAWSLNGASMQLRAYDTDIKATTKTNVLCTLECQPARNHWASLGYEWPLDNRDNVIYVGKDGSDLPLFAVSTSVGSGADNVIAHVHVLWKGISPQEPLLF